MRGPSSTCIVLQSLFSLEILTFFAFDHWLVSFVVLSFDLVEGEQTYVGATYETDSKEGVVSPRFFCALFLILLWSPFVVLPVSCLLFLYLVRFSCSSEGAGPVRNS